LVERWNRLREWKDYLEKAKLRLEVDSFLKDYLREAGYAGMSMSVTPLGTQISIYAQRTGLVIGVGGRNIRELTEILEKQFNLSNPQIAVVPIENPDLEPYIVACRVADALVKGVRYRRVARWAINRMMRAGALGAQIMITGKLGSERSRFEKLTAGYLPHSGEPAISQVKTAVVHVLLKPGMVGIKVKILPPNAKFPDVVELKSAPAGGEIAEVES